MLIAEQKRKESISEYIIFMYQTEDLIRAYNFDLGEIYKYVIQHFPVEDNKKTRIRAWYRKVANQMKKESYTNLSQWYLRTADLKIKRKPG